MIIVSMAAATTGRLMTSVFTIPLPIVAATAVPVTRAPTILSTAAIISAKEGERTRVETTVAMALGASVQPLTNSAASTRSKTSIRMAWLSAMLERYPLKDVSYIFTTVSSSLHIFIDLPPSKDVEDISAILEHFA